MTKEPKKKTKTLPIILLSIVAIGAFFGIKAYIFSMHHVETDDAQLEANISPVLPRVSGYVNEIRFEDNQRVKKGELLLSLDDRDLKIKVDQAKAAIESANAAVAFAKANYASAQASSEAIKANKEAALIRIRKATQDYARYEKLLAEKSITQQAFDAAQAEKETAEAQLAQLKKQEDASDMQAAGMAEQVKVAEAAVKQRQTELDFAMLQLSYASILAPQTGTVSKKNVQAGQYVQAGQPLFTVVNDSDIWVVANFKETQVGAMKVGTAVDVVIDAFKNKPLKAYISSFSPATGARFSLLPPDNATGNFVKVVQRVPVKIKLKADAEMLKLLRPGLSASVTVNIDEMADVKENTSSSSK
ncbi:MAG TPA: HlyD family secretion protein [Bacteroidia bacterium]|jgi:membrane fusion protein (multidrug efflux system)|nr:HlyD family secretion protein [Bacteroidia bacterium]